MFNLEQSIAEWRRKMVAGGIKTPDVLNELESHLRDEVDQHVRSGLSVQKGFEIAIQRMGKTESLRSEFQKAEAMKRVRLRTQLFCLLGVAVSFLIATGSFGYFVILPMATRASAQYAAWIGFSNPQANASFAWRLVIGVCVGLAMPVGVLVLVKAGILNHKKLVRLRPCIIVVNLILGAVLTTPELVTQVIIFVPLQLLYEASVLLARIRERREQKSA